MNKELLRNQYLKYSACETLADTIHVLSVFENYILKIIESHHPMRSENIVFRDGKMINQMMLTKVKHIQEIIRGITITLNENSIGGIIDPTVVANIIRNVYETVCTFNLIYRNTRNTEQQLIVYNLWVIAGLSYRQKLVYENVEPSKEIEGKIKLEKQQIDELKAEIKVTTTYRELSDKCKSKIQSRIESKDYKIGFINGEIRCYNWQDLTRTLGIKGPIFSTIYTYFSLYTHPSNVAVFQFGKMFENGEDYLRLTNFNLRHLINLLSIFTADYLNVFPEVLQVFESESIENQLILNLHNTVLRGQEYRINDVAKYLD